MEAGEALSTAAQVAVALAGFAGVVVVFRTRAVHEWSPIDKFRLRLLLSNSILSLTFCMVAMLLLTIKPPPPWIWRGCSGFAFVVLFLFGFLSTKTVRALLPGAFEAAGVSKLVFYLLSILGTAATFLQLYNLAVLNVFWAFFAAIVLQLLAAAFQFVRIILLTPPEES